MVVVETVLDLPALAGYKMTAVVHTAIAGMAVVEATVGFDLADRSYAPVLSPNTHTKRRINYQGDDCIWEEQKGYSSVERGLRFMKFFSAPEYALHRFLSAEYALCNLECSKRCSQAGKAPWKSKTTRGICTPAFATGTLCGRIIVIIDDVCTTCAMPLFAAGAEMVWGLVLARPVA
jgi:hypothetical protein